MFVLFFETAFKNARNFFFEKKSKCYKKIHLNYLHFVGKKIFFAFCQKKKILCARLRQAPCSYFLFFLNSILDNAQFNTIFLSFFYFFFTFDSTGYVFKKIKFSCITTSKQLNKNYKETKKKIIWKFGQQMLYIIEKKKLLVTFYSLPGQFICKQHSFVCFFFLRLLMNASIK